MGFTLWAPGVALASAPVPTPSTTGQPAAAADNNVGPATPGTEVCTVTNTTIDEITGMVATDAGIVAIEGGDKFEPGGVVLWTINPTTCAATNRNYGFTPVDPQDLAIGADGAIWVADTGDGIGSGSQRNRVTLEKVQVATSGQAVPYRAQNPTSGAIHAEAMLMQADETPVLFVNESGKVGLFVPSAPMPANTTNGLPTMQRVGEFTPARTGTRNPLGNIGNSLVTGAARSPDGSKVVVRTASDAYEFTVTGGDIVKAITQGKPRITPLPNEENGQAISYSADGLAFLTLTMSAKPKLRSYKPYVPAASPANVNAETVTPATTPNRGFFASLSFNDITLIAVIFALLGLGGVVAGIIGILRYRKGYRERYGDPKTFPERRRPRRPPGRRPVRDPDDRGPDGHGPDGLGPDERGPDGRGRRRPGDGEDGADRDGWGDDGWEDDSAEAWGDGREGRRDGRRGRPRNPDEHGQPTGRPGRAGRAPMPTGNDGPPPRTGGTYGSGAGGTTYGSGASTGGTTYGTGAATGGTTYGSGGTTYGSGGTTYGGASVAPSTPTSYAPQPGPGSDHGRGTDHGRGNDSGRGNAYRGAARVGPPPEPPPGPPMGQHMGQQMGQQMGQPMGQPPEDGPPREPRRPSGQVYGGGTRYPAEDERP